MYFDIFFSVLQDMDPCVTHQGVVFTNVRKFDTFQFDNRNDISCIMRSRAVELYGLQVRINTALVVTLYISTCIMLSMIIVFTSEDKCSLSKCMTVYIIHM